MSTWHLAKWMELPASLFWTGDRRMEAENYLAGGYGMRLAMEAKSAGWERLGGLANVWQPNRLKGIQVSPDFGTPFLAATQLFDLRPIPRKFLSLDRTDHSAGRFLTPGTILVTCSGSVGRATLAHKPHEGILVSHDLLRIDAKEDKLWGWLYAYLRSPQARAMMSAAQYGHIIKHLEVSHLNALPVPVPRDDLLAEFRKKALAVLAARNEANTLLGQAEAAFEALIGSPSAKDIGEGGFAISAQQLFAGRRRMEGFFHNPSVQAIRNQFRKRKLKVTPLAECGFNVWLPNRFKRIDAEDGVELLDSSDLFEINPDIARRIADIDFGDAYQGRVKPGWILVARSGQVYGLNGSVAIANDFHKDKVVSDDIIRIAPKQDAALRSGYLYMALSHPKLGRPLVKALIYGSSIPHLEVADVQSFGVVRLPEADENRIADLVEQASARWAYADILENRLAADAEALLDAFLSGETSSLAVA